MNKKLRTIVGIVMMLVISLGFQHVPMANAEGAPKDADSSSVVITIGAGVFDCYPDGLSITLKNASDTFSSSSFSWVNKEEMRGYEIAIYEFDYSSDFEISADKDISAVIRHSADDTSEITSETIQLKRGEFWNPGPDGDGFFLLFGGDGISVTFRFWYKPEDDAHAETEDDDDFPIDSANTVINLFLNRLYGASEWALEELEQALYEYDIPYSIMRTGWDQPTSRLAAAELICSVLERHFNEDIYWIAERMGIYGEREYDEDGNRIYDTFDDTDDQYVTFLKYAGITNGIGDNLYGVDGYYTRAQMVTMIGRVMEVFFGAEMTVENSFSDVPDWAAPYVGYAESIGITNGIGEGLFGSNNILENQQAAVFAHRWLKSLDAAGADEPETEPSPTPTPAV